MTYIEIFTDSFGLFQFFFWKLVFVIPIFVVILCLIKLFYFIIKK